MLCIALLCAFRPWPDRLKRVQLDLGRGQSLRIWQIPTRPEEICEGGGQDCVALGGRLIQLGSLYGTFC